MELEIKKLEKAVCDLTAAIKALKVSIDGSKYKGKPLGENQVLSMPNNPSIEGPKTVCTDTDCGVINSRVATCDHTFERYRSEYNCG
ncbi:MAG: hypothetical protein NPINA01_21000 [Nitrospinaceae bacterium]|nr:MAG: hypothetical protein NPINA01_21000 [Nitrospinaceae bacterium]